MAIVVEILNRSKKMVERHRFNSSLVSIGRSYENDVIISDEYVDPFHLNVELMDDGTFTIHDKASLNGIKLQKGHRIDICENVCSGELIQFGRSRLRIIDPYHQVSPTERLSLLDKAVNKVSTWPLLLILMSIVIGKELWLLYLNTPGSFQYQKYSQSLLIFTLTIALYISAWGVLGKIVRHESRYLCHASCLCILLLFYWLYLLSQTFIVYNFNTSEFSKTLDTLFIAILIGLFMFIGLHLSTYLSDKKSLVAASIVASCWFIYTLSPQFNKQREFSPFPHHNATLLAPQFQIKNAVSIDDFLDQSEQLFNAERQVSLDR